MSNDAPKVVIVGTGIVGTQCALHLQQLRPGADITMVDRAPFAYDNASCGNMGGFAVCEVRPLATPANLFRAIRWAFDPLAPFTLRLRHLPDYLPWMCSFVKAALTPGHVARVIAAQEALMVRAHEAHRSMLGSSVIEQLVSSEGAICIYRTRKRMMRDWAGRWRLFRERGERCEVLSRHELRAKLPSLDCRFSHAIHVPAIRHWRSPAHLLRTLHEISRTRGIKIMAADVSRILSYRQAVRGVQLADRTEIPCDHVVIAAGAWSRSLCASVGDRVPLDTERGYATTLPLDRNSIHHLLLFPDDEFVATPMSEGLRIGGTVELAGLRAPPNFARIDALVHLMRDYFPSLDTSQRSSWMGFRPSMPDGLPVIGPSARTHNALYAFGHGHVGVTQSAITGRLIAQTLCGEPPDIDLAPFSIDRFQ